MTFKESTTSEADVLEAPSVSEEKDTTDDILVDIEKLNKIKNFYLNQLSSPDDYSKAMPEELSDDEYFIFALIKHNNNGAWLAKASARLRKNKEFVLKAMAVDIRALQFADDSLRDDDKFIYEVTKKYPEAFPYVSARIRLDSRYNI